MAYYEFPYTENYDQDLGWLIRTYKELAEGDEEIQKKLEEIEEKINNLNPDSAYTNVKSYGAKGDGVTDDSDAIQTTIDKVHEAGGGVVFVPKGTYILSKPINLYDYILLLGEGSGSKLKVIDNININDNIVKLSNVTGAGISNLCIDGNRDGQTEAYTQYAVFIDNGVFNYTDHILVENANGVGIHVYNCTNCNVNNSVSIHNRYHGIEMEQDIECIVSGCHCLTNDRHGLYLSPGEQGGKGTHKNIITNSVFSKNSQYGVSLGISVIGSIGLSSNNTITGCQCNNNQIGIDCYINDSISIENNTISDCTIYGARIGGSNYVKFTNNKITACPTGLQIEPITYDGTTYTSGYNLVSNNMITCASEDKAALYESGGNGNNYILDNVTYGFVTISSSDTVYKTVSFTKDKNTQSYTQFKGIGVTNGDTVLPDGVWGLDSPWANVLRIFNPSGNTQFVSTNGNVDYYIGGNHLCAFNSDNLNMDTHEIHNCNKVRGIDDGTNEVLYLGDKKPITITESSSWSSMSVNAINAGDVNSSRVNPSQYLKLPTYGTSTTNTIYIENGALKVNINGTVYTVTITA